MMIVYFYEGNLLILVFFFFVHSCVCVFFFSFIIIEFVKRNDFLFCVFCFSSRIVMQCVARHSMSMHISMKCVLSNFFCLLFPESLQGREIVFDIFSFIFDIAVSFWCFLLIRGTGTNVNTIFSSYEI